MASRRGVTCFAACIAERPVIGSFAIMPVRVLLIVLSCAPLGFAPAPFPKAERARQDPLDVNGTWEFVRSETGGRLDPPSTVEYLLEMTKDVCIFAVTGG